MAHLQEGEVRQRTFYCRVQLYAKLRALAPNQEDGEAPIGDQACRASACGRDGHDEQAKTKPIGNARRRDRIADDADNHGPESGSQETRADHR